MHWLCLIFFPNREGIFEHTTYFLGLALPAGAVPGGEEALIYMKDKCSFRLRLSVFRITLFPLILLCQADCAFCQESFSSNSVRYELALTQKTAADQKFLLNDRIAAKSLYEEASKEANLVPPDSTDVNSTLLLLLKTDVAYRQALLTHGLEFWGSTYSQTPAIPVQEFAHLNSTFQTFDQSLHEMNTDLQDASQTKTTIQTFDALAQATDTSADVAALQQGKAQLASDYYNNQLGLLQDRISQDFDRQKEIGRQTQSFLSQAAAKREALNSLIAKSLTSSIGIPVDVTSLAGKPLDQQVLSIGTQLISSNDSDLLNSLSSFSDTSATMLKYYQGVQSLKQEVSDDVQTAQQLGLLLRNPSLDKLQSVGGAIFTHLDSDTQTQWKDLVAQSKSLAPLLQLSANQSSIRDALGAYLSKQADLNQYLNPVVEELSRTSPQELLDIQRGILSGTRGLQLTDKDSEVLAEFLITSYTSQVCSLLPHSDLSAVLNAAQVANVDDLHAKLVASGIASLGSIRLNTQGTVTLSVGTSTTASLNLQSVLDQVQLVPTALTKDQVTQVYERMISRLDTSSSVLSGVITKQLLESPYSALIMKYVTSPTATIDQAALYGEVMRRLPAAGRDSALTQLAGLAVGSDFEQKSVYIPPMRPQDAQPGKGGADGALMQSAATALLGAAVPEAAVAEEVITMLTDLSELDGIADQISRLYSEDKEIEKEQLELQGMEREARFAEQTAEMDKRIAQASFQGAVAQGDIYKQALRDQAADQREAVVKAKLQLPGLVFKAELLRRYFDGLERSLALWRGDPRQTHGFFEAYVRSNPEYLRYILDEDIHLYDWLDRSVEGTHIDFETLRAHWDQLVTLSTNVCQDNGCSSDSGVFGSVTQTAILKLSDLVPKKQMEEFAAWKQSATDSQFTFSFMLDPGQRLVDPTLNNVRVVDVRLAGVKGPANVSLTQTRLEHSGISYIPNSGSFFREVFQPETANDLQWPSDSFDTEALRLRWTHPNSRKPLEGYGLYSLWTLTLLPTSDNRSIDDLVLRFAVQFNPTTSPTLLSKSDPNETLRVYTDSDNYFEFTASDLGLLGDPAQVSAELTAWEADTDVAQGEHSASTFRRVELVKR